MLLYDHYNMPNLLEEQGQVFAVYITVTFIYINMPNLLEEQGQVFAVQGELDVIADYDL